MNGLVKTLVAEAAAEQEASSFDQAIKEMLQETVVPQVKYLPNSVIQFTENITKNFSKTAELLIIRANELEIAAAELREMAEKLRMGAPELTQDIKDWVDYERECAERCISLSLVKKE